MLPSHPPIPFIPLTIVFSRHGVNRSVPHFSPSSFFSSIYTVLLFRWSILHLYLTCVFWNNLFVVCQYTRPVVNVAVLHTHCLAFILQPQPCTHPWCTLTRHTCPSLHSTPRHHLAPPRALLNHLRDQDAIGRISGAGCAGIKDTFTHQVN